MGQVRAEAAGGVQRDLFGRHVDWAARAESLADGGHILVTRSVYPDAFGWIPKPRVSWKEHGFYVVKDDEPAVEVFEPHNGNITEPLEHLHGKKVSGSWQHRLNDGIRTFLRTRANRFLLAGMGAAIVVLSLVMYATREAPMPTPEGGPKPTIERPRPSLQTRYAQVVAELTRFEIAGDLVTLELTFRSAGETQIPPWICPSGKTPRMEGQLEAKHAKLIDQATGESWEPFLYGGSLWEWCGYWQRDQSVGAWMTFRVPNPNKKSFSFSLPILNGTFNKLG